MPPPKVDTSQVTLDETELRYLDSKGESTAKTYLSNLKRFRVYYPPGLVGLIKQIEEDTENNKALPTYERVRPGEAIIKGFIEWHRENEYSNKATLQALNTIQNALKYYGIIISLAFIETPPDRPMRENRKHEWTLPQIKQYVEAAEYLREKTYILFAFQSGLGISDILNLNYSDIQREYEAGTVPLAIQTYRQKTNFPIRTFIGRDTVKYLSLYLSSRPDIQPNEPIFTFIGDSEERATPVAIQKLLRQTAEKLDFVPPSELENSYSPVRSHSLRSGFRSQLTGAMDGDLIEMMMSHDIGQQRSTYVNLPTDSLRELYSNFEHLLAIEKTSRQEHEEQSKGAIPETAMNIIRDQGQRIAELEAQLATEVKDIRAQLKDLQRMALAKYREEQARN